MATNNIVVSSAWVEVGTGLSTCVVQPDEDVLIHMGSSTPSVGDAGFILSADVPVELPSVGSLGGGVWAKSRSGSATVLTHASA